MLNVQLPWECHNFASKTKSDVNTRLNKGGKPTKAFWKIWHRIEALFKDLNNKLADGWLVFDEDGEPIKSFVIDDTKLVLGVRGEKSVNCIVHYGWEWSEGNETLAHYKNKFSKWKMIPPHAWQKVVL